MTVYRIQVTERSRGHARFVAKVRRSAAFTPSRVVGVGRGQDAATAVKRAAKEARAWRAQRKAVS